MGWRDLIQSGDEKVTAPWCGGRMLRLGDRTWTINGDLPRAQGWYSFRTEGRSAFVKSTEAPDSNVLQRRERGYLVGDRLVVDGARVDPDPLKIVGFSERVFFLEPGLDRFARVVAGRAFIGGPLIYVEPSMPIGPEAEVLFAFLERKESLDGIAGVTPALDAAFRMELWHRAETARLRAEAERRRREEEERLQREEKRREIASRLGDAQARRQLAAIDFEAAARASLSVGGAELLDQRASTRRGEMVVCFRMNGRAFECVCDARTLQIIDAGICLSSGGVRGDTFFTLESLPGVIRQAENQGVLHVVRHVHGQDDEREDWDD